MLLASALLSVGFTHPALAADNARFELDRLIGHYEMNSPRCTEENGLVSNKCPGLIKDRLVIERFSDDNVRVIIHSHQENNHQCHMAGIGRIVDNVFQYCLDYEPGTCLTIAQDTDKLVVRVVVVAVEGSHIPFCGSRATLDGLEFPLASKLDPKRCRRSR